MWLFRNENILIETYAYFWISAAQEMSCSYGEHHLYCQEGLFLLVAASSLGEKNRIPLLLLS